MVAIISCAINEKDRNPPVTKSLLSTFAILRLGDIIHYYIRSNVSLNRSFARYSLSGDYCLLPYLGARLRAFSVRCFLRRRILTGVTSTSSSSSINSNACSSVCLIGGTSVSASSVPEARTLVSCLPLMGLTTRSLDLESECQQPDLRKHQPHDRGTNDHEPEY